MKSMGDLELGLGGELCFRSGAKAMDEVHGLCLCERHCWLFEAPLTRWIISIKEIADPLLKVEILGPKGASSGLFFFCALSFSNAC